MTSRPGWDNHVMEEMRANIAVRLREFWDAGIRGPDFVWAATGPALEAYSKYPVVRKANEPMQRWASASSSMQVRRMVVDYIVGQVLSGEQWRRPLGRRPAGRGDSLLPVAPSRLRPGRCARGRMHPLRHCLRTVGRRVWRRPGTCWLRQGRRRDDQESRRGRGSGGRGLRSGRVRERQFRRQQGEAQAVEPAAGEEHGLRGPQGKAVPLIDRIHRVMHLWKDGDLHKVDEYLDQHALRRHELFKRVVQSLIELSTNSERSLLESISNHIGAEERGRWIAGRRCRSERNKPNTAYTAADRLNAHNRSKVMKWLSYPGNRGTRS